MKHSPDLYWLPPMPQEWRARLLRLAQSSPPDEVAWQEAISLAGFELNFTAGNALDRVVKKVFGQEPKPFLRQAPERLAILSSCTTAHLHSSLRVAALRRGIWLDVWENNFGLYYQALMEEGSGFYDFAPTSVLFSVDADHLTRGIGECRTRDEFEQRCGQTVRMLESLWKRIIERFGAQVLQQTIVPRFPDLLGGNEHRLVTSPSAFINELNLRLRERADASHIDIVALDTRIARDGLSAWFNLALWFKSKQEITLSAGPMLGEMVLRQIAVRRGTIAKCCVLDLDNTLWGGVVGDHGLDNLIVGQGSATAEAFTAIQEYALALRRRGVLLAVCSKNDEAVARAAFENNPDMRLKMSDFACFVANWEDKPTNLRRIASDLNIGLDSLVFVDDNPFERDLVRRSLPMVFVPELPEEPELIPTALSDAGSFEGLIVTAEDFARAGFYAPERRVSSALVSTTDMAAYLTELEMKLQWSPVDAASLSRTTQLINKTNQFNLTTRRYTETQVKEIAEDRNSICLQFRLLDRFGDNGLIAVVIGRMRENATLEIDAWLMSCRVLSRGVEEGMLNVLVEAARTMGASSVLGTYLPTARNGMVSQLYDTLGFTRVASDGAGTTYRLDVESFVSRMPPLEIERVR